MTRFRLFSVVFFLAALGLYLGAWFWPPSLAPAPNADRSVAGTYVLDKAALIRAALSPELPGRQIWERKRKDALAALELVPPDKAAKLREELDALIKRQEAELNRQVRALADASEVVLTLRVDKTFRLKWTEPDQSQFLSEGQWAIVGEEVELTYLKATTLDGKRTLPPPDGLCRLQLQPGRLTLRKPEFPHIVSLVRQSSAE